MEKTYNVLVIEDYDIVSKSIYLQLKSDPNYNLNVKIVDNFNEAKLLLMRREFDIVFLDYILKDDRELHTQYGDALIDIIREQSQDTKIIFMSKIDRLDLLVYFINKLKVNGYVLKSRKSLRELSLAINCVIEGGRYLSPRVKSQLAFEFTTLKIDPINKQLLVYASRGILAKDMPSELVHDGYKHITLSGIEKRLKNLKSKFEVNSLASLVSSALRLGIIE
ncbi:MAG: response regulator [Flavobacteriales bacterium]